jgi:radical SAM protein with 4Fe4S-binding SPASM domain
LRRITKAPNTIFLNLTDRCQLSCVYCSREIGENSALDMDSGILFGLLDEMLRIRVFRVILTGGEPLIHPEFHRVIDRLSGKMAISILSNGMALDREMAKFLRLRKINSVGISLDAPDRAKAEKSRGENSYQQAVSAIEYLLEAGVGVHLNAVLTRINLKVVPEMINFCAGLGVNNLGFAGLKKAGAARKAFDSLELDSEQKKDFYQSWESWRQLAGEKGVHISWTERKWGELFFSSEEKSDQPAQCLLPCSAGIDQCAIKTDGTILPCNYMDFSCGNVFEASLETVWRNSPQLKELRSLTGLPVTQIPECCACDKVSMCNGGCRASAFSHLGNILSPDPNCWFIGEKLN